MEVLSLDTPSSLQPGANKASSGPHFLQELNTFFSSLLFTKIKETDGYAIYGAGISGSMLGKNMYVLLFVEKRMSLLPQAHIRDLQWKSLQTRSLKHQYPLKKQLFLPPKIKNIVLPIVNRSISSTKYLYREGNNEIEVLLLHDPKKKSAYQYYDKMSLSGCLDTFNCVISL